MQHVNPLGRLSVCRFVPVSAPWQPGVRGPREDHLLLLLGLVVTGSLYILQSETHTQWAAREGGWSQPSGSHNPPELCVCVCVCVRDCEVPTSVTFAVYSLCVPVHREAERDEAGRANRTRTDWVLLLLVSWQIQGIDDGPVPQPHVWLVGFFSFYLHDSELFYVLLHVQLQWICEKGLSVGHSRITTLGNPSVGKLVSCSFAVGMEKDRVAVDKTMVCELLFSWWCFEWTSGLCCRYCLIGRGKYNARLGY